LDADPPASPERAHARDGGQVPQIYADIQKTVLVGSLEKWEPVRHKNERAYFCAPGLPIIPKAQPWELRGSVVSFFISWFSSFRVFVIKRSVEDQSVLNFEP
jgi:hypothetical protein